MATTTAYRPFGRAAATTAFSVSGAGKRPRYYYNVDRYIERFQTQPVSASDLLQIYHDWIVDLAFDDYDDSAFLDADLARDSDLLRVYREYNARCPILIWTYAADTQWPVFASVRRIVYREYLNESTGKLHNFLVPEIEYPIGSCCTYTIQNLNVRLGLRVAQSSKTRVSYGASTAASNLVNNGLSIWLYQPDNIVCSGNAGVDAGVKPEIPLQYFLDPLRLAPFVRVVGAGSADHRLYAVSPFVPHASPVIQQIQQSLFPRPHPDLVQLYQHCALKSPPSERIKVARSAAIEKEQWRRTSEEVHQRLNAVSTVSVPSEYIYKPSAYSHAARTRFSAVQSVDDERRRVWGAGNENAAQTCCQKIATPWYLRITTYDGVGVDVGALVVIGSALSSANADAQVLESVVPLVSTHVGNFLMPSDLSVLGAEGAELPCAAVEQNAFIKFTLRSCPSTTTPSIGGGHEREPVVFYSRFDPTLARRCTPGATAAPGGSPQAQRRVAFRLGQTLRPDFGGVGF